MHDIQLQCMIYGLSISTLKYLKKNIHRVYMHLLEFCLAEEMNSNQALYLNFEIKVERCF